MTDMSVTAARVFDLAAAGYDAMRRCLIPCFDDFYGNAISLATAHLPEKPRVLDLGAGTGMLSAMLLKARPDAAVTLLDASSNMLHEAEKKLSGKIHSIIEADMVKSDFHLSGPWDAIISSLAIHHLEDEDKVGLFQKIRGALKPHGVFVNADQVSGASDLLTNQYKDQWVEACARAGAPKEEIDAALLRQATADRCASVEHQIDWMRLAGLREAHCPFRSGRFAVFSAGV